MPPLVSDKDITDYLTDRGKNIVSVKELTGGTANFVWRITSQDGNTSIVKHAEPYIKTNPTFAFTTERMAFETASMNIVGRLMRDLEENMKVGPPKVLDYDMEENVLTMTDGGGHHLKALYATLTTEQVQDIGQRLGTWLATLHKRSMDQNTSIGEGGNPTARKIYRYSYQGLQKALISYGLGGFDGELGIKINEIYGPMLETDDDCVCMGDFWPGNVIVDGETLSASQIGLTIVDWEICRRGIAATDVAQFTAEAHLLDRFSSSNHKLASAFLNSYVEKAKPDTAFWKRFLVHWAVHVIFWPTVVPWSTKQDLNKVAEYGVEAIKAAISDDADSVHQFVSDFMSKLDN